MLFRSDESRKSSVARYESICQDGEQPFPRRVDDPAADDSGGVASEPHAHGLRVISENVPEQDGDFLIFHVDPVDEERQAGALSGERRLRQQAA